MDICTFICLFTTTRFGRLLRPRSLSFIVTYKEVYCDGSFSFTNSAYKIYNFFPGSLGPRWPWLLHCRGFSVTVRHITVRRIPLYEGSALLIDLYVTTHNTHKRLTSMPRRDSKPQSQPASGCKPTL